MIPRVESDTVDLIVSVPVITRAGEGSPERKGGLGRVGKWA